MKMIIIVIIAMMQKKYGRVTEHITRVQYI